MKSRKSIWTTREGEAIMVKDMSDTHLRNTIRYLERKAEFECRQMLCNAYSFESSLRGEMAQLDAARIVGEMEETTFEDYIDPIHEAMVLEWERREALKKEKAESCKRLCP